MTRPVFSEDVDSCAGFVCSAIFVFPYHITALCFFVYLLVNDTFPAKYATFIPRMPLCANYKNSGFCVASSVSTKMAQSYTVSTGFKFSNCCDDEI